jgi:4-hydroxy-2-oxoheptanedioate aldolase
VQRATFRTRLSRGDTLIGSWSVVPSPEVVEILALAGFDFVIIDLEHGPFDHITAQSLVRAATLHGCAALLRVPSNDEVAVLRGLEIGSGGILVPHVSTAKEARNAVKGMRYGPEGSRGFSPYTRAAGFGVADPVSMAPSANSEIVAGVLVEGIEGVANLTAIAGTPGVDLVYIGVYDLAQSLGFPGEPRHPEVLNKVAEMVSSIRKSGASVGMLAENQEEVERHYAAGVNFIAYRADCAILLEAARNIVAVARRAAKSGTVPPGGFDDSETSSEKTG